MCIRDSSVAERAERTGASREFRSNTLVPAIVDTAMSAAVLSESEAIAFLSSIDAHEAEWSTFEPTTPFQRIVFDAINGITI